MKNNRKIVSNMRNKVGLACMILGTVLVLAALSLFLWNRQEDKAAGKSAQKILPRIMEEIKKAEVQKEERAESYPDPYSPAMRKVEINGYTYVGYLSMPSLGLNLPVMSGWGYTQLKVSPCRYSGSTKTGNLVICAHNYEQHFGHIGDLLPGDEVYFTDMDGVVWMYAVEAVDILAPTDTESMISGKYDLTLFTCTYGGKSRVTVRCKREKGSPFLEQKETDEETDGSG